MLVKEKAESLAKEKAESQYDDEMVSASRAKILQRTTWKPCEINYLSFLSFRCDFARECF